MSGKSGKNSQINLNDSFGMKPPSFEDLSLVENDNNQQENNNKNENQKNENEEI